MSRSRWALEHALTFDVRVPSHPTSIAVVRRAAMAATETCGKDTMEIVGLIFTELVTNAVLHGGLTHEDRIDVALTLSPAGIEGTVTDPGRGFHLGEAGPQPRTDGGFGLFIVERLARRWNTSSAEGKTTVRFEL